MNLQYKLGQFLISSTARMFFSWKIVGKENIPAGGALIAANHISVFDPPLIGSAIRREMHFFAKIELFGNAVFGFLLKSLNAFPAHRGEADRRAWKTAISLLKRGKLLLFFPEGTRSHDGEVRHPKPGLARLAYATGVPVVPAAISGSNCLKDVFLRRAKLRVGFARPLSISEFELHDSGKTRFELLSDAVMAEIRKLKREVETI